MEEKGHESGVGRSVELSVVVPAHNPHPGRLRQTLAALARQTLPADRWECLLIDNASTGFPGPAQLADVMPANLRIVFEPKLGLSEARRRGFEACAADIAVLVDDDNVIAPHYLETALGIFASHPRIGAIGGKVRPAFEEEPPQWAREFDPLLALRDLGDEPLVSSAGSAPAGARLEYPLFAPLGAGMALRRAAWTAWLRARAQGGPGPSDRRGKDLASSGDNDLVLCAMRAGWEVGYFPALTVTHLIPRDRVQADYLSRLNRGIQKSWMEVLTLHGANPWPCLSRASAQLRKLKAWFTYRAWSSPAARVRWHGACGHFDGRISRAD